MIAVALSVAEDTENVSLNVSESNPVVSLSIATLFTGTYNVSLSIAESNPVVSLNVESVTARIPSNYGLITWNGSYLLVS